MRQNGWEEGRWINTAQHGALMKSEMAKETEGKRRQEVKDRQLVKGRGGRICYRQEMNARFLSMSSAYRDLQLGNEEGGKGSRQGRWKGEEVGRT